MLMTGCITGMAALSGPVTDQGTCICLKFTGHGVLCAVG